MLKKCDACDIYLDVQNGIHEGDMYWFVMCPECGDMTSTYATREEAIKAWNEGDELHRVDND